MCTETPEPGLYVFKSLNFISSIPVVFEKQSTENRKNRIFSNTFFILKKCAIIYKI